MSRAVVLLQEQHVKKPVQNTVEESMAIALMVLRRQRMSVISGSRPKPGKGSVAKSCGDAGPLRDYPGIVEFATAELYGDGAPRVSPSIILFVEAGCWKLCLNDKDLARVAFFGAETLPAALEAAETGLQSGHVDWRASRGQGPAKRAS